MFGLVFLFYGAAVGFSPTAKAYITKKSLDKYWLPPHLAKYSVRFVDGAFALGLGATLVVAAFFQ